MALTRTGKVLVTASLSVALLALFWPGDDTPDPLLKLGGNSSKCPLGFGPEDGVALPDDHPPVPGMENAPAAKEDKHTRRLTLYFNCTVWTADEEAAPVAEALLVDERRGVVLGAGSTAAMHGLMQEQVDVAVGRRVATSKVDLHGRFLMPGFVDSHVHFLQGGLALARVDLRGAASREEFVDRVRRGAREMTAAAASSASSPGGAAAGDGGGGSSSSSNSSVEWLLGGQWDESLWGGQLPDRTWLDEAAPGVPALLVRMDGHMALASSAALGLAGLTKDARDPEGGILDRGDGGELTGVLRDHAIRLVSRHIPEPTLAQRRAALKAASAYALSRGVTTVHDMGRAVFAGSDAATWDDLQEVYEPAADAGQLGVRIYAFVPLSTWPALAAKVEAEGRAHMGGFLFVGGVKEFADGSLGSRTALMWEAYEDGTPGMAGAGAETGQEDGDSGARMLPLETLRQRVIQADAVGLQVAVHAIGDRAVDEVVWAFGEAAAANSHLAHERRHRIEHVQHISGPQTAEALAEQRLLAIPNPQHLLTDLAVLRRRLGPARSGSARAFALRTLRAAGVSCAHASDWPVVDLSPLTSLYAAVHRAEPGCGSPPWAPEERLEPQDALRGHTWAGAHAGFMEDWVGSLRPGLRADFVVLSSSPLDMKQEQQVAGASAAGDCDASGLPEVVATFVDGVCKYGCGKLLH